MLFIFPTKGALDINFYFVNNFIHLSDALFLALDYDQKQIEELKATSNHNLFPLNKIINNNKVKDYQLLKFEQGITKKLEGNDKGKVSNELRDKYNELILKKEKTFNEKDIKNNEEYLKLRLTENNKKYKDLLKF